jgi:hypothetical protein
VNVLLLAVLDQLGLEQTWVTLNLVGSGCNASAVDECLQVLLGVVGDTDGTRLLLGQLSHGLPCVDNRDVVEHLDITVGLEREELLVGVAGLIESNGEVHKVKVEVLKTELGQAVVESAGDILGAML